MSTTEVPGVRRAALMLHAMEPADRGWLLTRLTAAQQGPIGAALEELRALGIPRESRLLRQAIEALAPVAKRVDDAAYLQSLTVPQCMHLAGLLAAEPPSLAEKLFSIRTWPWTHAVLAQLPPGFVELPPPGDVGGPLSRLDVSLLAQLRRRLLAAEGPAPVRRRAWRRSPWKRRAA